MYSLQFTQNININANISHLQKYIYYLPVVYIHLDEKHHYKFSRLHIVTKYLPSLKEKPICIAQHTIFGLIKEIIDAHNDKCIVLDLICFKHLITKEFKQLLADTYFNETYCENEHANFDTPNNFIILY